jgi:polysaccharide export outer membrane protein
MKSSSFFSFIIVLATFGFASCASGAADSKPADRSATSSGSGKKSGDNNNSGGKGDDNIPATDPDYHLTNGDEIAIAVYNQTDVSISGKIDSRGVIRMPLVGDVNLANKTVREAEGYLEKLLVEKEILVKPTVYVTVREYAPREASVLGAVNSTGKYRFPKEQLSVEIVDLITSMGGFQKVAKSNEVSVTHTDESGKEKTETVNVEAMINGRSRVKSYLIYPGDRLFVPERLF